MDRGGKLAEPCSLPSVGSVASEAPVLHREPGDLAGEARYQVEFGGGGEAKK